MIKALFLSLLIISSFVSQGTVVVFATQEQPYTGAPMYDDATPPPYEEYSIPFLQNTVTNPNEERALQSTAGSNWLWLLPLLLIPLAFLFWRRFLSDTNTAIFRTYNRTRLAGVKGGKARPKNHAHKTQKTHKSEIIE